MREEMRWKFWVLRIWGKSLSLSLSLSLPRPRQLQSPVDPSTHIQYSTVRSVLDCTLLVRFSFPRQSVPTRTAEVAISEPSQTNCCDRKIASRMRVKKRRKRSKLSGANCSKCDGIGKNTRASICAVRVLIRQLSARPRDAHKTA